MICSVLLVSNQICMNARFVGQSDYRDVRPRRHVSVTDESEPDDDEDDNFVN